MYHLLKAGTSRPSNLTLQEPPPQTFTLPPLSAFDQEAYLALHFSFDHRMNSLEEQVKTLANSINGFSNKLIKVSESREPPKPELQAEILQRPLQPVLEVKDEVFKMSRQLSTVALTQAISATMSLPSAARAATTTTVLTRTSTKPESVNLSTDCTDAICGTTHSQLECCTSRRKCRRRSGRSRA
jgi:hypothetical protein